MPRQRYRQNPLPLGPDALAVELFGAELPNPPGLQVAGLATAVLDPLRLDPVTDA